VTVKSQSRLLLVSHSADRSGAPLFMLGLSKWIATRALGTTFDVLLKESGDLVRDFESIANTMIWTLEDSPVARLLDRYRLWGRRRKAFVNDNLFARFRQDQIVKRIAEKQYDLLFVNSFASAELIPRLAQATGAPIVCRAPELKAVVDDFCDTRAVYRALEFIDVFIAVSGVVRDFMTHELGIPSEKVVQIPGFYRPLGEPAISRGDIRRQLGVSESTFLVCGCGTISPRKGVDLFLKIAGSVYERSPGIDFGFVWVGGDTRSELGVELVALAKKRGLSSRLRFVGPRANPVDYFSASDVFALTSREDPFPLVVLEAASVGLPTVCFDGPVGSAEFLRLGSGMVVPDFSVDKFADVLLHLNRDRTQLRGLGDAASLAVQSYSYDSICERVFGVIEKTLAGRSPNVSP
jgi:hypothetical protein